MFWNAKLWGGGVSSAAAVVSEAPVALIFSAGKSD
jgi:hypothetical protein